MPLVNEKIPSEIRFVTLIGSRQSEAQAYQEALASGQRVSLLNRVDLGLGDLVTDDAEGKRTFLEIKSAPMSREEQTQIRKRIVDRYLQGLFGQEAERLRSSLHRDARCILGNSELADEAVQTAFLKAWQKLLKQFETQSSARLHGLSSWLRKIVQNAALDILADEKQTASLGLLPEIAEGLHYITSSSEQPESAFFQKESQTELLTLIELLPKRQKQVILLFHMYDWSEMEIANALRLPPGTVKSRLSNGRKRLRELMREQHIQRHEINVWSTSSLHEGSLWQFRRQPKES